MYAEGGGAQARNRPQRLAEARALGRADGRFASGNQPELGCSDAGRDPLGLPQRLPQEVSARAAQACMTRRRWWAWTMWCSRPACAASAWCSCSPTTGPCTAASTSTTSGRSRRARVRPTARRRPADRSCECWVWPCGVWGVAEHGALQGVQCAAACACTSSKPQPAQMVRWAGADVQPVSQRVPHGRSPCTCACVGEKSDLALAMVRARQSLAARALPAAAPAAQRLSGRRRRARRHLQRRHHLP